MAIELIDKIVPKNHAFIVIVDSVNVGVDSTTFVKNLNLSDDTLQKALQTIDGLSFGGGGGAGSGEIEDLGERTVGAEIHNMGVRV